MILRDARKVALQEVTRALSEVLRDDSPLILQRAENLVAIAENYQVKIEDLIVWIHCSMPNKQWTSEEFKRWCIKYLETLAACSAADPDPAQQRTWELCGQCYERVAHLIGGNWFCDHCGVVLSLGCPPREDEPAVPRVH